MIYDTGSGIYMQCSKYISVVYIIIFSSVNFFKDQNICPYLHTCSFNPDYATGYSTEKSRIIINDFDGQQYGCRNAAASSITKAKSISALFLAKLGH